MKLMVFGASGQLGKAMIDVLDKTNINIETHFFTHDQLDITNARNVDAMIVKIKPSIVINASAFTAVDAAESNAELAFKVNQEGVQNIAMSCESLNIPILHISTDYVFDGLGSLPYQPSDLASPKTIYGKSKLAGEEAIINCCKKFIIIRTSWLFSQYRKNFLTTMVGLAQTQSSVTVVNDQIGSPTNASNLAEAIITLTQTIDYKNFTSGLFHFAGEEPCSWFSFAEAIFEQMLLDGYLVEPMKVLPVSSGDYPTQVTRPQYSALNSSKFLQHFSQPPHHWQNSLRSTIQLVMQNN